MGLGRIIKQRLKKIEMLGVFVCFYHFFFFFFCIIIELREDHFFCRVSLSESKNNMNNEPNQCFFLAPTRI